MTKKTCFLLSAVAVLMALCGCTAGIPSSKEYTDDTYGFKFSYPREAKLTAHDSDQLLVNIIVEHPDKELYFSLRVDDYAQVDQELFQLYEQGLLTGSDIVLLEVGKFLEDWQTFMDMVGFSDFNLINHEQSDDRLMIEFTYNENTGFISRNILEIQWKNGRLYTLSSGYKGSDAKDETYDMLMAIHDSFTFTDQ